MTPEDTLFPPSCGKAEMDGGFKSLRDYLASSPHPEAVRSRLALEEWYATSPAEFRRSVARRVQLGGDSQASSALFELYVYALLGRMGYEVQVPVPTVGASCPEFEIFERGHRVGAVECTLIHLEDLERPSLQLDQFFFEAVPRHMRERTVAIDVHEVAGWEGPRQPSAKAVAELLDRWVRREPSVTNDEAQAPGPPGSERVWLTEVRSGLRLSVSRIERCGEGPMRSPIWFAPGGVLNLPRGLVRKEVREKLRQHKKLPGPLVVVVGSDSSLWEAVAEDVQEDLFGSISYVFRPGVEGCVQRRNCDGLWTDPGGTARERCPEVVVCPKFRAAALERSNPELWVSPWAAHGVLAARWNLTRFDVEKGLVVRAVGSSAAELMGLVRASN